MRLTVSTILVVFILALIAVSAVSASSDVWQGLAHWAVTQQRALQTEMALAVQAIRAGDPGAWLALMAATGAYGFVHAVGPGHGKVLIGGIGLGAPVSATRLTAVAVASSLAQAVWAIVLVYGGLFVLQVSTGWLTDLAERYLAPASYLAIAAVGVVLALTGLRTLWTQGLRSGHGTAPETHARCGCEGHGPSAQDVAQMGSVRGAAVVVLSIAVRPCAGALILLVIAWQLGIAAAGAAAVLVMGLGTAATTGLVAASSVAARGITLASSRSFGLLNWVGPSLQLLSGLAVIGFAMALLRIGAS